MVILTVFVHCYYLCNRNLRKLEHYHHFLYYIHYIYEAKVSATRQSIVKTIMSY